MSTKKNIFENFSWTFLGSIAYAFSQWLLIIILAKFGSPEIVGVFSLGLAITAPIILFCNLQLRNIIATDGVGKYEFNDYFGTRLFTSLLALIFIIITITVSKYSLYVSFIILLVGLTKVIESLSELTHGFFQQKERMDFAGKSMLLKSLTSIITVSIIFIWTRNLILALIGLTVAWLFRLLFYDLKIAKNYTKIRPRFSFIKKMVLFSLPLGFVSVINSLNTNIPRYLLEDYTNMEQLGYFSAIAYILIAGNLLIRPLSLVLAPRLAKSFQNNNIGSYLKLTRISFGFSIILGIIMMSVTTLFGNELLTILYSPKYAEYSNILQIMVFGSIISYFTAFLNTAIIAAREFKIQPYLNIITTIIAIASSFVLIPKYEIHGAAYVTLIVFCTQFILSMLLYLFIVKKVKMKNANKL